VDSGGLARSRQMAAHYMPKLMMNELDKYFTEIGSLTYYFQSMEVALALLLSSLISEDQKIGQIVSSQLSFNRLCNVLDALFRHKITDSDLVNEFEVLLSRVSKAEETRNRMLHSFYLVGEEEGEKSLTRAKITSKRGKGLKIQIEDLSIDELSSLTDEVGATFKEIVDFIARLSESGHVDIPSHRKE